MLGMILFSLLSFLAETKVLHPLPPTSTIQPVGVITDVKPIKR